VKNAVKGAVVAAILCVPGVAAVPADAKESKAGEALFKTHCAVCHPNGGNIINPEKTLHKKSLDAYGIKSEKDIIGKMRNPGPGMPKFDEKAIPESEARQIAEYILETLK
jgi:cytochrome c6